MGVGGGGSCGGGGAGLGLGPSFGNGGDGVCPAGMQAHFNVMGFVGCLAGNALGNVIVMTGCYVTAQVCAGAIAASLTGAAAPVSLPVGIASCAMAAITCGISALEIGGCIKQNIYCTP